MTTPSQPHFDSPSGFYFKLDGREVVPATREEFADQFEHPEKRILQKTTVGDMEVSTVFLGLDHSFGRGKPLFFETMIFGGRSLDGYQLRYPTYVEAMAGHAHAVKRARCSWARMSRKKPTPGGDHG